jgi:hypothetical protein
LSWIRILELLDVPVPSTTLPIRTTCPLCQGHRFNIYEDNTSHGSWHYCFDCSRAGDMIELCAAVWNCSVGVAIRRLHRKGLTIPDKVRNAENINRYIVNYTQVREQLRVFWEQCRQNTALPLSEYMGQLMSRLYLTNNIPTERWKNGPNQVIGMTSRRTVEQLFNPGDYRVGKGPGMTFRGGNWKELLTIAFNDLPERICGFLFIGRQGRQSDRVFRLPKMIGRQKAGERHEAGLAGLWTVEESKAAFREYVVAMGDAYLAARLQLRNFSTSDRPLPLVAYHDGPKALTKTAWRSIERRKIIIWGWQMTPSLVHQAIICDGLIALSGLVTVNKDTIDHYLRHDEPRILMQRIIKKALPWREALVVWAKVNSLAAIEELLLGLESYKVDVTPLYALSPQFAEARGIVEIPKEVTLGYFIVSERNGCWWIRSSGGTSDRKERLLMNGVLRVDTEFLDNEVLTYAGRLIIEDGTEVHFKLTASRLRQPLLCLKVLTLLEDKQIYISPDCGSKLIQAALLFQQPKIGKNTWKVASTL